MAEETGIGPSEELTVTLVDIEPLKVPRQEDDEKVETIESPSE